MTTNQRVILGGVYAAHGGDEATLQTLIREYTLLRAQFPEALIVLMGDTNIHLDYVVSHSTDCRCSHCRQPSVDKRIQAALKSVNLHAWNSKMPTHSSNTVIDLICSVPPLDVVTDPEWIDGSDHRLVYTALKHYLHFDWNACLGRVAWANTAQWDQILARAETLSGDLLAAIRPILGGVQLRPPPQGGNFKKTQGKPSLIYMHQIAHKLLPKNTGVSRHLHLKLQRSSSLHSLILLVSQLLLLILKPNRCYHQTKW
jgi:hypothetical protein